METSARKMGLLQLSLLRTQLGDVYLVIAMAHELSAVCKSQRTWTCVMVHHTAAAFVAMAKADDALNGGALHHERGDRHF